ncbi:hypothetical protein [Curtobacterium sp. Leaf261]|uniref:hypothetical protein n=1 Tax=Curtobacterium sp. Leaf261 TaxID=1736311 RepID=UPI0009E99B4A|nr:hypothetical protein [Curtobacterium sp. Leaf261]
MDRPNEPAAEPRTTEGPEPRELARRLALLLDHVEVVRGTPYTFAEVRAFVEAKGIPLSRARWGYMLSGDAWRVRDADLLVGLAELFGVDVGYLRGEQELPAAMDAEMHLVRALRRSRVQNFAARNLGDTDPAAYRAIAQYLEQQQASRRD